MVGSCSCCRWWAVGWVVVAVVGGGQYAVGSCSCCWWWAVGWVVVAVVGGGQ